MLGAVIMSKRIGATAGLTGLSIALEKLSCLFPKLQHKLKTSSDCGALRQYMTNRTYMQAHGPASSVPGFAAKQVLRRPSSHMCEISESYDQLCGDRPLINNIIYVRSLHFSQLPVCCSDSPPASMLRPNSFLLWL